MEPSRFRELSERILDEVLSWDPTQATSLGWSKYDDELRDPTREAYARQARRLREIINELSSLNKESLNPQEQLDRDLAVYLFKLRIYEIEVLRFHERMSTAPEDIGEAIFLLFVRDHPSLEERLESIIARLEKAPRTLEMSRSTLAEPNILWNETAIETCEKMPAFLDFIQVAADAEFGECELTERLRRAVLVARDAFASHKNWLESDVLPGASMAMMNKEEYEGYLKLKQFGISPDQALRVAYAHLEAVKREMRLLAEKVAPGESLEGAIQRIRDDHPANFEGVLKEYRMSIKRARDFLLSRNLVTLPAGEKLEVVETPHFMRHLAPFAAQLEPAKFGPSRTGYFLITPNEDLPGLLREHSFASIDNTSVHEGYPGHHVQGVVANTNTSMIRALCTAPDFSEGWALYAEELMISEGYNDTPIGRLVQLNDLVFRIVRVVADIKLSRQEITIEEAADMIASETGMDRGAVLDDVQTYPLAPTYYMSYFIGKLALLKLKEDAQRALGDRFSLKFFHDALLESGCMPMQFMRRALALRIREQYGVDLGPERESLYDYSLRVATR